MRTLHIVPAVFGAVFLTVIGTTSVVGGASSPDLVAFARADADRGGSVQVAATPPPPRPAADPAVEVVERTNAVRAQHGLAPLTIQSQLVQAAQAHSNDQAAHQRMSHTGSNGSTMADRVDATGYPWSRIAENVAAGQRSATEKVAAVQSGGHNISLFNMQHFGSAKTLKRGICLSLRASSAHPSFLSEYFCKARARAIQARLHSLATDGKRFGSL